MIYIAKGNEPEFMRKLRRKGLIYKDLELPQYQEKKYTTRIRQVLLAEQHYLCGYCCEKIDLHASHVEHMHPKSIYQNESLDYYNLIASCIGRGNKTCGMAKDDQDSDIVYPTDADCEAQFYVRISDGTMQGRSEKAKHTIDVLNLNAQFLCDARMGIMYEMAYCSYENVKQDYIMNIEEEHWPAFFDVVKYVLQEYAGQWDAFQYYAQRIYS